jgi:hypothetical protein
MLTGVGPQSNGVPCKVPEDQRQELLDTINSNNLAIDRLWFDIEPTASPCQAWQQDAATNLQVARDFVTVLGTTGREWGIYRVGTMMYTMYTLR